MARQEEQREDLLRDAKALVDRAEFIVPGFAQPIFIGFRANRAASFYFGQDATYHFNPQNELRRAHANEQIFKAENGKLIAMHRDRTENSTTMLSRELTEQEQRDFLNRASQQLKILLEGLESPSLKVNGEVLSESTAESVVYRATAWLRILSENMIVADKPNVT